MATANQRNLLERNRIYATDFKHGDLATPPAKKYTVVTCMDARIDPAAALGISLGDAHVIRNAGGSAREALRSLIISQQMLGTTEVLVVKHTGCGMLTFSNDDARSVVKKNLGNEAGDAVKEMDFLPFGPSLEEAVKEDVEWLKTQKTIPSDVHVSGWIYEVESGRVKPV